MGHSDLVFTGLGPFNAEAVFGKDTKIKEMPEGVRFPLLFRLADIHFHSALYESEVHVTGFSTIERLKKDVWARGYVPVPPSWGHKMCLAAGQPVLNLIYQEQQIERIEFALVLESAHHGEFFPCAVRNPLTGVWEMNKLALRDPRDLLTRIPVVPRMPPSGGGIPLSFPPLRAGGGNAFL